MHFVSYQGPLLNGFSLSENAFVDWLTAERARGCAISPWTRRMPLMQREEKQPTATFTWRSPQQAVALDPSSRIGPSAPASRSCTLGAP
jgi:hypothetical protein